MGLVSTPFRTDLVSGRVLFSDLAIASVDIMPLVEVVGREMGASLDQLYSYERSRAIAISEDRIRLARDLHDGVLQSLTGIRLELRAMAQADAGVVDGASVADRLAGMERALALEQRELRRFIEGLKPSSALGTTASLADRLDELRRRIALEWRAPVEIRVRPEDLSVPAFVDRAVPLMVHEGIVNALKHAHPSRVAVDVRSAHGVLTIAIEDDGRGFALRGRHDHAALVASNAGPISLRERVTSLGGEIEVESSSAGSRVELSIPLEVASCVAPPSV
jgi:signal transduction histidine kinase